MVLSDKQLREWGYHGGLTPYRRGHVNPASVDLTWSGRYTMTYREHGRARPFQEESGEKDEIDMLPGRFYLLDTAEYIKMPLSCCGLLMLKSSFGRCGLSLAHTGFVDPGFEGTLSFELSVMRLMSVFLRRGDRVVQLVLMQMQSEPEAAYAGHYQGSREPMAAWAVSRDD